MSLVQYLKMKKKVALGENKMDIESRGRLTADMFHDIFVNEKHNITHRIKYIQNDLTKLVKKNEMHNNTRTTELNREKIQERLHKEEKINL